MATRKTTTKTGKTVQDASAKKIAKEVFAANPEMKEVHITSDGTPFYAHCDAKNHARSLKNKAVVTLTKAQAFAADDDTDKDAGQKPDGSADNQGDAGGSNTDDQGNSDGQGSDANAGENNKTDE